MNSNTKPSERFGIVGVIDPDANGTGTLTSAWIDMGHWQQVCAIIMAGDLGSSATIDAKYEQATSSGGAGAKDITPTSRAITQMTQAVTDKSNKQVILQIRANELDKANGFRYVRLSFATGTATSDSGAIVLGFDPRHTPNTSYDLTTVDEIVG